MIGISTVTLNQATITAALQKYFTEVVFDASQLARITKVEPKGGQYNSDNWTYEVTIDSRAEEPHTPDRTGQE